MTARRVSGRIGAAGAVLICSLAMSSVTAASPGGQRIVGGDVADPADWPYAAALTTASGDQFCGGTVITPYAVLTAAHCALAVEPDKIRVVIGRPDLDDTGSGAVFKVRKAYVHPLYLRKGRHDVAVLRLKGGTFAAPAELPTQAEDETATAPGGPLRVAGWGATKPNGSHASRVLRDVSTTAIKDSKCAHAFGSFRPGEQICTEGAPLGEDHTSACYGDSGGPLVADTPGGARLVGVVSYGARRCGVGKPTVFARVADNLGFIKKKSDLSR